MFTDAGQKSPMIIMDDNRSYVILYYTHKKARSRSTLKLLQPFQLHTNAATLRTHLPFRTWAKEWNISKIIGTLKKKSEARREIVRKLYNLTSFFISVLCIAGVVLWPSRSPSGHPLSVHYYSPTSTEFEHNKRMWNKMRRSLKRRLEHFSLYFAWRWHHLSR